MYVPKIRERPRARRHAVLSLASVERKKQLELSYDKSKQSSKIKHEGKSAVRRSGKRGLTRDDNHAERHCNVRSSRGDNEIPRDGMRHPSGSRLLSKKMNWQLNKLR